MDADQLSEIASELRERIRDESDPEANAAWLLSVLPDPAEWFRLSFVLAAACPTSDWLKLTQWTRPKADLTHIDEIAVERACHGDRMTLTRRERALVVDKLTKRGLGRYEIAERLGISDRTVERWRAANRRAS